MSIFAGYLMPKPSLWKDSSGIIQPITGNLSWGDSSESECNSVTGVWTQLLQCHSPHSHYTTRTFPN